MKDNIISKLKNNKRALYLTVISVIVLLCLVLNVTFSAFTNTQVYEVANIKVGGLNYNLTVDNVSTDIISAPSGNVTMANITLTSNNSIATTYELYYDICIDSTCTTIVNSVNNFNVKYSSDTIDDVSGTIGTNETKSIKLAIINNTNINYYIKLKVNAGFTNNTLTLKGLISSEYLQDVYYGWNGTTSSGTLAGADTNNYGFALKSKTMATYDASRYDYSFNTASADIPYVCANIGSGEVCVNYNTIDLEEQCDEVNGTYDKKNNVCEDENTSIKCEIEFENDIAIVGRCFINDTFTCCGVNSDGLAGCE